MKYASSGNAIRRNLPTPLTSFVGRSREMAEIKRLLVPPAHRGGTNVRLLTSIYFSHVIPQAGP